MPSGLFVERTHARLSQPLWQWITFIRSGQWLGPHVRAPLSFLVRGFDVPHLVRLRVTGCIYVIVSAAALVPEIAHDGLLSRARRVRRLIWLGALLDCFRHTAGCAAKRDHDERLAAPRSSRDNGNRQAGFLY